MKQILNPNHPIYISYAQKESSKLLSLIVANLEKGGVKVNFDIRDNGPTKSIRDFEAAIGNANTVIVILSDAYFESFNCMCEMVSLVKRGEIDKRVIFIDCLKEVQRNAESHNLIKKKWEDKFNEHNSISPSDTTLLDIKKDLGDIVTFFSTFWGFVKDQVAFMSADVESDEALGLLALIKERLSSINPMIPNDTIDPMNSSAIPAPQTIVNQTGNQSIYISTVNGNVTIGSK